MSNLYSYNYKNVSFTFESEGREYPVNDDWCYINCSHCRQEYKIRFYSLRKNIDTNDKYLCKSCCTSFKLRLNHELPAGAEIVDSEEALKGLSYYTDLKVHCDYCREELIVKYHELRQRMRKYGRVACHRCACSARSVEHGISYNLPEDATILGPLSKTGNIRMKTRVEVTCTCCGKRVSTEARTFKKHTKNNTLPYSCKACQTKYTCNEKYGPGIDWPMQSEEYHGKTKSTYYKDDLRFDSSWELAFYIYHVDKEIPIKRLPKSFHYIDKFGKPHSYFPDFEVDGKFLEIKGKHLLDENGDLKICYIDKKLTEEELSAKEATYMKPKINA